MQSSSDQQQKFEIKTTFLTQSIQSPALDRTNGDQLPQKQQLDSDNLLELMRQPREQVIRACDLPAIVQSIESQNQAVKGEYKWRGHSWMVCDMSLLQSFQRNVDEVCVFVACFSFDEQTRFLYYKCKANFGSGELTF